MKCIRQVFALSLSASALLVAMGAALAQDTTHPCSDSSGNWRKADQFSVKAEVNTSSGATVTANANDGSKTVTLSTNYKRIGGYQDVPGKNKSKEYTTTFSMSDTDDDITCTAELKANSDGNVKYVSDTCTSVGGYTVDCHRNYGNQDLTFTVKYTVNKP